MCLARFDEAGAVSSALVSTAEADDGPASASRSRELLLLLGDTILPAECSTAAGRGASVDSPPAVEMSIGCGCGGGGGCERVKSSDGPAGCCRGGTGSIGEYWVLASTPTYLVGRIMGGAVIEAGDGEDLDCRRGRPTESREGDECGDGRA